MSDTSIVCYGFLFADYVYSQVYKARNNKTGQLMALKRIRMRSDKDGVGSSSRTP